MARVGTPKRLVTIGAALALLLAAGFYAVAQQTDEAKRDRVYCATGLLRILEEPAMLASKERP